MRAQVQQLCEVELPAHELRAALLDEGRWPQLLPGLRRLGGYWRFQGELYELRAASGSAVALEAACPACPRLSLRLTFALEDATVTTRVLVTASAEVAAWDYLRARARLARLATQVAGALPALAPASAAPAGLSESYPRTVAAFAAMGALPQLEQVARLDAAWDAIRAGAAPAATDAWVVDPSPSPAPLPSFDLIYAGGGLGLLHAAAMARRYGWRVLLFDRGEVGTAHREWNISREELAALVDLGLFTWAELGAVVMREYERGFVRFHREQRPAELWLPHVLDVAIDAGELQRMARRRLEAAGGVVLDGRAFRRVLVPPDRAAPLTVELARPDGGTELYRGRLLLDGMGSTSPLALQRFAGQPFAAVCPTVGTVVSGLQPGAAPGQHQPDVGEILLSIDHAQRGQQYMWEGFPGRGDELTVYLFYYETLGARHRPDAPGLLQLFEDYFALLPSYKRPGPQFRHHKPVFGYIPARHSLRRQEAALLPGVLPIGDAAAQQSPLTFCGFGSHVRNLGRTTALLDAALRQGLLAPQQLRWVAPYQANASLGWVFSRFMQPWGRADDVNVLQNIFLGVLRDLGPDLAQRFFRDQMRWGDYHQMVLGMLVRRPRVVLDAWAVLGAAGYARWADDYLRYSGAALLAALARGLGAARCERLARALAPLRPGAAFALRAALAEWRASGWLA